VELVRFSTMKPETVKARERARRALTVPTKVRSFQRAALTGSFAVLFSLGAFALAPTIAWSDEPRAAAAASMAPAEIEREAESIARSIMSPFCPGRTVSACPNAGPWRDDIRKWVAEGVDAIEIRQRLADRVPEHNLMGVPKNRLGWVLPVGLGVLALGILIFLLRYLVGPRSSAGSVSGGTGPAGDAPNEKHAGTPDRVKAGASPASPGAPSKAPADDYDARIDQELDTLEERL
jgi:cytochrome c-type biogenesis protein CcmH/NrfF